MASLGPCRRPIGVSERREVRKRMVYPAPEESWLPPSTRNDAERAEAFERLLEGIPPWLRETVDQWIKARVRRRNTYASWSDWDPEIRTRIQAALHREIRGAVSDLSDDDCLDVIDCILREQDICGPTDIEYVEARLSQGRSAWRATPRGLERRVDPTLQAIAASTFEAETRPAQYLRDAWHKAWGSDPDASGAYRDAVRAVEAAYAPIALPRDPSATLGKIIAALRDKPAKFAVRLSGRGPEESVGSVRATLALLWTSQLDRHGTAKEDLPMNVTLEQAQDAVALATALVHLAQREGFTANAG